MLIIISSLIFAVLQGSGCVSTPSFSRTELPHISPTPGQVSITPQQLTGYSAENPASAELYEHGHWTPYQRDYGRFQDEKGRDHLRGTSW